MTYKFIYLPHPYLVRPDAQVPLGILYLASMLRDLHVDVEILNYSSYTMEDAVAHLPQSDVFGITSTSLELPIANSFAKVIKNKYPHSIVMIGGPGTYTDDVIDRNYIDCVVKGEAESRIDEITQHLTTGSLNSTYVCSPMHDLDSVLPARDLLGTKQGGGNAFAYQGDSKSTLVMSSRGCPFQCSFCCAPNIPGDTRVRYRSVQSVYDELVEVRNKYDINEIVFVDDMFTAKKKRMIELCEKIQPLGMRFRMSCRAKPLDREMVQAAYDAGCREVSIGVESFDDSVLKVLNKYTTAADNVKALELLDSVGIGARLLLMIRTPGQREETVDINIKYLEQVPYKVVACTVFAPIPGSDIWENPNKYNIEIFSKNFEDYNYGFFNSDGIAPLKPLFKINDRSLHQFHEETDRFRKYLLDTERVNKG